MIFGYLIIFLIIIRKIKSSSKSALYLWLIDHYQADLLGLLPLQFSFTDTGLKLYKTTEFFPCLEEKSC